MKSMDTQSLPPTEPLIGHMNYFPKLGLNQSLSYGFQFENHPMVGKSRKPRQTKWYWNRDLPKSKQGRELSRKKEETNFLHAKIPSLSSHAPKSKPKPP
uniref:Uncharacterized protein n=1 Tax=Cucumis melo TaxID=3656 RepID=A0A9I9DI35_CUCME